MRLRISRLCVFTWRDGQMVVDDPVRHRQYALSPRAQRVLHRFADWTHVPDTGDGTDTAVVRQLLDGHVLVAEGSPDHRREDDLGPWAQWGTAATYYHLATRNHRDTEFATAAEDTAWLLANLTERPQPPEAKGYPDAARVALPPARTPLPGGLEDVLRARRTTRRLQEGRPVSRAHFATLLRWVAGPVHRVERPELRPALLKASPSPGSVHTLEVYPVVMNVAGVDPGIYHYHCTDHALEPIAPGPVDPERVVEWCGGQTHLRHAGALLLYTAVLDRMAWKYRTASSYRALFMEVGHFSQTAYLVGTALGLGVCFTASTRDEAVEDALGLDWTREILLGVSVVGVPAPDEAARQKAMLDGGAADFSFAGDAWDGRGP
ncbi:MAG TPA: SagB/ThcOx family dehydrogenase [Streptosporangiaceae bacterium]|jgi:SagB-type dehydrogenase family enzyme